MAGGKRKSGAQKRKRKQQRGTDLEETPAAEVAAAAEAEEEEAEEREAEEEEAPAAADGEAPAAEHDVEATAVLVRAGDDTSGLHHVTEVRLVAEKEGMRSGRSRAASNGNKASDGYVSKLPNEARAGGDLVVTGGSERTCVVDAVARSLELDSKNDSERVRKLRQMVPTDADANTRYTDASKVLREQENKKLVPVTAEFNHAGGLRLNLLLAGKKIFKKKRKLLVGIHVKVPNAEAGDNHCVFFNGKAVYNNTYVARLTRSGDFSSYPVTEVQEKDLTPEGARAFWGSLYPTRWVALSRVFEVVELSDPRVGL